MTAFETHAHCLKRHQGPYCAKNSPTFQTESHHSASVKQTTRCKSRTTTVTDLTHISCNHMQIISIVVFIYLFIYFKKKKYFFLWDKQLLPQSDSPFACATTTTKKDSWMRDFGSTAVDKCIYTLNILSVDTIKTVY